MCHSSIENGIESYFELALLPFIGGGAQWQFACHIAWKERILACMANEKWERCVSDPWNAIFPFTLSLPLSLFASFEHNFECIPTYRRVVQKASERRRKLSDENRYNLRSNIISRVSEEEEEVLFEEFASVLGLNLFNCRLKKTVREHLLDESNWVSIRLHESSSFI